MTTGPKTPEGKAAVALNSVKHGLRTAAIVVPGHESEEEWEDFRESIIDDLQPVGAMEDALAQRAAEALWRLRRVIRAERMDIEMGIRNEQRKRAGREAMYPQMAEKKFFYADAFHPDLVSPASPLPEHDLDKMLRYEAHLNRQLYQALHELEARRDRREGKAAPLARLDVG